MDALYGPRTGHYNLRARKPRDYAHLHATIENDDDIFDIGDIDFTPLKQLPSHNTVLAKVYDCLILTGALMPLQRS